MPLEPDKRRALRYPADFKVIVRWSDGDKEARAINLSRGGILLASEHPLPAGTMVQLIFALPRRKMLSLKAMIRHSAEDGGLGIEFMQVGSRESYRLDDYLEYLDAVCREEAGWGVQV